MLFRSFACIMTPPYACKCAYAPSYPLSLHASASTPPLTTSAQGVAAFAVRRYRIERACPGVLLPWLHLRFSMRRAPTGVYTHSRLIRVQAPLRGSVNPILFLCNHALSCVGKYIIPFHNCNLQRRRNGVNGILALSMYPTRSHALNMSRTSLAGGQIGRAHV